MTYYVRIGGFTLFEVAISLIVVAFGIVSFLLVIPAGIKGQQLSRFQILASAKAIEMMSVNANQWKKWDLQQMEGWHLGDCNINQIAQSPLVEQKACNWRHGSMPVPLEITRRLDSDNDEIQQILNDGGYLFYSSPRPIASADESKVVISEQSIPNESQQLVYGFIGYPQQPGLAHHPCKAWPYYDWYPAPPRIRSGEVSTPTSRHEDSWRLNEWPALNEFEEVKKAWETLLPDPTSASKTDLLDYCERIKALIIAVGGMSPDSNGIPGAPPGTAFTKVEPYQVLAASYLAHALVCFTASKHNPRDVEKTNAQQAHEISLTWVHRYARTNPYDWGIERALNFQNAWDNPLLQYALFDSTSPTAGIASLAPMLPNGDVSWRIISAQPIVNSGTSVSYGVSASRPQGNKPEIDSSWGNNKTFNLTNVFQPAERCRQLVFWAVDWKAYEDSETLPSAPQDASRIPYDSNGVLAYHWGAHKYNNPERFFAFSNSSRNDFTGNNIKNKKIYLGIYGADRNGNGKLDIGPVPKSVRMRAIPIARFTFYTPRMWTGLRN